jgi:hypothetical protein
MCSGLVEGKSGRRPNLAPMAAWPAAAAPVCLLRSAGGALGSSPESGQPDNGSSRLSTSPAAERLLSGRRRRLLSGGWRPAGLRLRAAAGGGSSSAGERRARERRPEGSRGCAARGAR